jgi:hypothetical protein
MRYRFKNGMSNTDIKMRETNQVATKTAVASVVDDYIRPCQGEYADSWHGQPHLGRTLDSDFKT